MGHDLSQNINPGWFDCLSLVWNYTVSRLIWLWFLRDRGFLLNNEYPWMDLTICWQFYLCTKQENNNCKLTANSVPKYFRFENIFWKLFFHVRYRHSQFSLPVPNLHLFSSPHLLVLFEGLTSSVYLFFFLAYFLSSLAL